MFARVRLRTFMVCERLRVGGEADEAVRAAAAGRSTLLAEVSDVQRDVLLDRLARSEAERHQLEVPKKRLNISWDAVDDAHVPYDVL
jgi:hypothetical protein